MNYEISAKNTQNIKLFKQHFLQTLKPKHARNGSKNESYVNILHVVQCMIQEVVDHFFFSEMATGGPSTVSGYVGPRPQNVPSYMGPNPSYNYSESSESSGSEDEEAWLQEGTVCQ